MSDVSKSDPGTPEFHPAGSLIRLAASCAFILACLPSVASANQAFNTNLGNFNGVVAYSNGATHDCPSSGCTYNQSNGNNIGLKWQCVEYVNRYYLQVYGTDLWSKWHGNANGYFTNAGALDLDRFDNGGPVAPAVGDLLISEYSVGDAVGHVAIVKSVSQNQACVAEQNWFNDYNDVDGTHCLSLTHAGSSFTLGGFNAAYTVRGWLRMPGTGVTAVAGDRNSDRRDAVWTVRPQGTTLYWTVPAADGAESFGFGNATDVPVTGDWNHDGVQDVGVFRAGDNPSTFYLDTNRDGSPNCVIPLPGYYPQDIPIAGDWDGDGATDVGAWNPLNTTFYLFKITCPGNGIQNWGQFVMGSATDRPVAGNWDGVGGDEVGLFQIGSTATTFLFRKQDGTQVSLNSLAGMTGGYGIPGDIPVVGDWDGDGFDTIGVYRPSEGREYTNDQYPRFGGSASSKAVMLSPVQGSTLSPSAATFSWSTGVGVTAYWLSLGTTSGGTQISAGSQLTTTSVTVAGLPANGSTVYARLWSLINNAWQYRDYTYTAASISATKAVMVSPAAGSTLSSSTATFNWTTGASVTAYWLQVGTTAGGTQISGGSQVTTTSATVGGLPTNGSSVYVRLWSLISGAWQYNDYAYTASSIGPVKAAMLGPTPGSTLSSSTVTFNWSSGTAVTAYWLQVGTTNGGTQISSGSQLAGTSATIGGLPTNGSAVYARLWSLINGAWQYNDYTYAATSSGPVKAAILAPAPGATLSSTTTFTWSSGTSVTAYWLYVGTTVGGYQISNSNQISSTSRTVTGLPTNGSTVYVRLWSQLNGGWVYADYTYTAAGPAKAVMLSPAPGATLQSSTATFNWTTGTAVTAYWLYVGTSAGSYGVFNSNQIGTTSVTVSGLPGGRVTLYVRLWSLVNSVWQFADYTYTSGP